MAFLDETGAKQLAKKIIEKAGSGASASRNYSTYTKTGANQYVTAQINNNVQTGVLYSWIPTIDSIAGNDSNNLCGLMSLDSYKNLESAYKSHISGFKLVYYVSPPSTNAIPIKPLAEDGIYGQIPVTLPTNTKEYSIKIYACGECSDAGETARLLIEVTPYVKAYILIKYGTTEICGANRSAGVPLTGSVEFNQFKKGTGFTITITPV